MNLVAGLDLAAVRDYSALVVAERIEVATSLRREAWVVNAWGDRVLESVMLPAQHYLVRHLVRWPQGTDPGDVVDDVASLLEEPVMADCLLRFDATGMGLGVKSLIRKRYQAGRFGGRLPRAITFTGAAASSGSNVAKVDLVSSVHRLLRERRLHLPAGMDHVDQLRKELLAFQVKVTAGGRETFAAQTESVHDDMVSALGLAVWGRPSSHAWPRRWNPEELAQTLGLSVEDVAAWEALVA